jgi:hypothetical protein
LAENAIGGIGAANEQAFLENRELAADEVAGAGLIGAGLGMGIGLGARGLGVAGQGLKNTAARLMPDGSLNTIAEKAAFRDLAQGADRKALKSVFESLDPEAAARKLGRLQLDEGLTGKGTGEALDAVTGRLKETGARFKAVGEKAAPVDTDSLFSAIKAQADEIRGGGTGTSDALASRIENELAPLQKRIEAGEPLTFEQLRKTRTAIRKAKSSLGADTEARAQYDSLYKTLTGHLDDAVKRTDDTVLGAEWKAANAEYADLASLKKVHSNKLAKEQSQRLLSFGEQHSGGQAALLGSLMTGNVGTGALLGIGTAAARKMAREKGAGWVARAANHLAQGGEVPSVTKLLAMSSQARQALSKHAVGQMVQQGARRISAAEEAPAGFAFGALANYSNPRDVASQYAAVTKQIEASGSDLEGMASRASQHLGALADEQPELAAAAQMKMANAVGYLRDHMPPSPPSSVLAMAAGNESKRLPPSNEQVSWLKRYRATVDPSVVYGEIARGHINPETVQTLQALYPAYLASVQMGTLDALNSMPGAIANMPYSKRLALDTLMGGTGQVEPTRRFTVQDRLAQANAEVTQAAGPQAPSNRKAPDIAQFGVTTSARLMST